MSRAVRAAAAAVVALLAAAGCTTNSPGELTAAAQRLLVPEVQQVREAAASGSYARLREKVAELSTLVRQEQGAGQVTPARAAAIMDAADALLQDASPSPSPTPSATSTSPSPTPSPSSSSESPSPTPSPSTTSPPPTSASPTSPGGFTISAGALPG